MSVAVGILSDSHGFSGKGLPEWISEAFAGVKMIFHAGDLEDPDLIFELENIAPCYAVRGNVDHFAHQLPTFRVIQVEQRTVVIAHRLEDARCYVDHNTILVIHGHTHLPEFQPQGNFWTLNPGSPVSPRGGNRPSVALAHISGDSVNAVFKYPPFPADR